MVAAAALLCPAVLRADVAIYDSTVGLLSNFYGTNAVPFVDDGTPDRPDGAWIGNTITFDSTLYGEGYSFLTSVDLATYNAVGNGAVFTLDLYSGSDPNTGTLLASSSVTVGHSQPEATFLFDLYVPQTITWVVSSVPAGTPDTGALDGIANAYGAPQVGSANDSIWYGDPTVSNSFTSDSTWAGTDGAATEYLGAEFFATPEPSAIVLLGSILGILGIGIAIARRRQARA
jgi:hypothetical protein